MFKKFNLIAIVKDFSSRMQEKSIDTCAGSTCFFLILSIIPLMLLLSSLIPYTSVTKDDLINIVIEITPYFTHDFLMQLIDEAYSHAFSITSISALTTIWSGALGMIAIIRGLNNIYEVEEKRNYFLLRFFASFYTLALIVIILVMLIVTVFGKITAKFLINEIPYLEYPLALLSGFKFLIVICGATIVFSIIYTYVPSIKLRYIRQLPGSLFTAIVWYMFSWLFSIYVNHTSNYNTIYGSLATPVIMMFWLYFCMYFFFIGAFINHFLDIKNLHRNSFKNL